MIYPPTIHPETPSSPKWQLSSKANDGDTALALFTDPSDLHETISPSDERALQWTIDLMMQRFLVGKYLEVNIFICGVLLRLQACARNFAELAVLRAFPGAAEACSDPSFALNTSMW
jgi:hypothetical protein